MKNYLKILLIFASIFVTSIIIDSVPREWLGDWKCQGAKLSEIERHNHRGEVFYDDVHIGCEYAKGFIGLEHSPTWHWGFRRYIVIIAGITLTIYSVVRLTNAKKD